jgi:hypothetical protein
LSLISSELCPYPFPNSIPRSSPQRTTRRDSVVGIRVGWIGIGNVIGLASVIDIAIAIDIASVIAIASARASAGL